MEHSGKLNEVLVTLFNDILDLEEEALITEEFHDLSIHDMHVIEAIGLEEPKSMTAVARALSVTVGTLTIAVNSLVKKEYVDRMRSSRDRRVVLISLTEKGRRAFAHHRQFHEDMVRAIMERLDEQELAVLVKALGHLEKYFRSVV